MRRSIQAPHPTPAREGQASAYAELGYLVIDNALPPGQLQAARQEAVALCRGDRGAIDGVEPADPSLDDLDVLRRYMCIHFPHKLSPLMRDLATTPAVVDAVTGVVGPNVKLMQSMLFIKSEGKPGQA